MAIPVVVHLSGEDAFMADLDELPNPAALYVVLRNLRKKDGKPLMYLTDGAKTVLYPWTRITFIETMDDSAQANSGRTEAPAAGTTILGFFRDDERREG